MSIDLLYFDYYINGENLSFRMNGNDMYLYIPSNDDEEPEHEVMYKITNISQFMTTRWQCIYSSRRYYDNMIKDGIFVVDEKGYGNYILNLYDWGLVEFWAENIEKIKPDTIFGSSLCFSNKDLYYHGLYFSFVDKIQYFHRDFGKDELTEISNSEWAKEDFFASRFYEKDLNIGRKPLNHYCLKANGLGYFEILAREFTVRENIKNG